MAAAAGGPGRQLVAVTLVSVAADASARSGPQSPFGSQQGQSAFQRTSRAVSAPLWSSAENPIVSQ